MAQETEPVAAPAAGAMEASPLESPSSKRRNNRKKNRRGSTTEADDGADGDEQETMAAVSPMDDVATADLISLPSPVAVAPMSTVDVFATFEMTGVEQVMGGLALAQDKTKVDIQVDTTVREDGLLKLPIHPSSGRIPRTPPSSPEPFLVHSPEKEQSRIAPLSPELLSTVVEAPAEVAINASSTEMHVDETPSAQQEAAPIELTVTTNEEVIVEQAPAVAEQGASMLSSFLAEMSLTNGSSSNGVLVEPVKPVETLEDVDVTLMSVQSHWPVADDNVGVPPPLEINVNTNLISGLSIDETTEAAEDVSPRTATPNASPMVEASLMETFEPVAIVETVKAAESIPVTTSFIPAESQKVIEPTFLAPPAVLELVQVKISKSTEEPTAVSQHGENSTLPESSLNPRRNKRKEDSPEMKLHTTPTVSSLFAKAQPAQPSVFNGDRTNVKRATPTDSSSEPKVRPGKRKGDVADVKPPPAPATTAAASKEIRPKRLIARPNSGSTLHKAKTDPQAKPKPGVEPRLANDKKKESMMNPTASSVARASAAEARKSLMKSTVAKKGTTRKPMRTTATTKSGTPPPNVPSAVDKSAIPPPAITVAIDTDDGQRNVKRRLNATEAEAASRRLYEDAKEAKARKDARRAELQETYTFAPQVNNFKRRTAPGESEVPSQDHFSRLHAQAKELQEKKRGLQQQFERDGCTFAPTISARAKRLAQPGTGPRYENLYKNAQEIKQKREEKLLERAKTTDEQCPFKPKIKASKSPVKTKPLYDFEREKQKRLSREQKKIESEMSHCTFKPKVTAKRMKSKADDAPDAAVEAVPDANPYNRLYQASIDRTERLQKLRQVRDEEEMAQAPFQPKITTRSRVLKAKAKTKEPFHKRLYNKDYMKKLDAEREQRRLEEEQQFSFKPEINEPPEEIKAKVTERVSAQKSIFERLYDEKDKMKEKIEMGEELRLQKEMAECTFRPQIEVDTAQSNGEPAPPVWERLLSYDKAQVIEEREKLKEQLEMQECTFKPEVKSPDALLMKTSPSHNVFDRLTSNGNSPLDPTRANFITQRPSSSPGRRSPDSKSVSIGQLIKSTKFSLPTERKKISRTYSISQPSSVNKPTLQRSTSFSGPKSVATSPTSTTDILDGSHLVDATVTENYQSWSAELDAKLRHL
ncbi:hypothetical protein P3T76_013855 [Phytophthora citrophthora]|uniref:Uncharacterized protein n=1 Tax=Phytophthora citrophthora TaxID=4793 RepID=A0AAD9LBK3_9STRA|nr:hypothetical protein P3T76_013855 [Phytophthora citrophthora]